MVVFLKVGRFLEMRKDVSKIGACACDIIFGQLGDGFNVERGLRSRDDFKHFPEASAKRVHIGKRNSSEQSAHTERTRIFQKVGCVFLNKILNLGMVKRRNDSSDEAVNARRR